MFIPVAIHKDDGTSYGVTVPDIPGVFSYGDTFEHALLNAKEAITSHVMILLEDGDYSPIMTTSITELQQHPDFQDATWGLVDIDEALLNTEQVRFNVSWPGYLVHIVDAYVKSNHETRSGFLAKAVQLVLNKQQ
jgi:predicted RNase H-like HicB family nuclease